MLNNKLMQIQLYFLDRNFQLTQNAAIPGHNYEVMVGTVEDCKAACLAKYRCKSFDYYKINPNKCYLLDKNKKDVGGLTSNYNNNAYDHYEKFEKGK